jgi:AraC-like DNA-binding protein
MTTLGASRQIDVMSLVDRPPIHPLVTVMVALFQGDPTLRAKQVSYRVGMSGSRLARLFKREMGVSIVDFRNDIKMERFFRLMEGKRRQETKLAVAVRAAGFGSYAQFHRLFKSRWSLPPRQYLERRAKSPDPA